LSKEVAVSLATALPPPGSDALPPPEEEEEESDLSALPPRRLDTSLAASFMPQLAISGAVLPPVYVSTSLPSIVATMVGKPFRL